MPSILTKHASEFSVGCSPPRVIPPFGGREGEPASHRGGKAGEGTAHCPLASKSTDFIKNGSVVAFTCITVFIVRVPKGVSNSEECETSFFWPRETERQRGRQRCPWSGFLHNKHPAIHLPAGKSWLGCQLAGLPSSPGVAWLSCHSRSPSSLATEVACDPDPTNHSPHCPGHSGAARSRHLTRARPASFHLVTCVRTLARRSLFFFIQKPQPGRRGAKATAPREVPRRLLGTALPRARHALDSGSRFRGGFAPPAMRRILTHPTSGVHPGSAPCVKGNRPRMNCVLLYRRFLVKKTSRSRHDAQFSLS